ncbi:hypothetical protein AgCh_028264 [Apium graveolens]
MGEAMIEVDVLQQLGKNEKGGNWLNHPNVVKLKIIGYYCNCSEDDNSILVLEYMPKGSLEEFLLEGRDNDLNWRTRLKIAVGSAKGLEYLHGTSSLVIHRDIKSSNILLDNDYTPKISDFGLAKFGPQDDKSHTSSRASGVLRNGVLYFLYDPADPNYNPFHDLIDDPIHKHAHRVLLSVAIYGSLIAMLVFLPVKLSMREEDLYEINVPLKYTSSAGTRIHRLACWFDVLFDGSTVQRWLTTAPGAPTIHWYQLHRVLSQPLYVMPGQEIVGHLLKMWGPGAEQGGILQTSSCKLDLKEPYYRMSQPQAYSLTQDQKPHQYLVLVTEFTNSEIKLACWMQIIFFDVISP